MTSAQTETTSATLPLGLNLNVCQGIEAVRYYPSEVVGAEPPANWSGGPTPFSEVFILLLTCERISIGQFERGPIEFVMEVHDNRAPIGDCTKGDYISSEVISAILVEDQDVFGFLKELGLPVHLAVLEHSLQDAALTTISEWRFANDDGSWQLKTDTNGNPVGPYDYKYRRFWENRNGGISYMDFELTFTRHFASTQFVVGEVGEPFLHLPGVTAYAAAGNHLVDASVFAPIHQFRDVECKEPL